MVTGNEVSAVRVSCVPRAILRAEIRSLSPHLPNRPFLPQAVRHRVRRVGSLRRVNLCDNADMPEPDLERIRQFIEVAKNGGASDDFLFRLLREQGWPERQIFGAFRHFYESKTGIPLPVRAGTAGAKDAFYLLLCYATLATWAMGVGSLFFSAINVYFPDPLFTNQFNAYFNQRNEISNSLASALVAFPVYLFVMWNIIRDSHRHPAKIESGIRKWLTYIALLLAAGTVLGDVVTFVAYLLRGELSIRFDLKVLAVLVISGGIFGYYLSFAKKRSDEGSGGDKRNTSFAAAAVLLTALAVVLGFIQLGPPTMQRAVEADEQRIHSLKRIVQTLYFRKQLPLSLNAMERDPLTRLPFTYVRKTDSQYDLCAVFDTDDRAVQNADGNTFWRHGRGSTCFSFDLNSLPAQ